MRSSKSRSRSKSNRPRPMGNIVNRVFDSSGPEGKVRGTPQQIIDKYLILARDAQLSNDRVAAENFLQHAEHYTRMLGEAQREMQREAEQRREGQENFRDRQRRDNGAENGDQPVEAQNDHHRAPASFQPEQTLGGSADVIDLEEGSDEGESALVETPESRQEPVAEVAAPMPTEPAPERRREQRRPPRQQTPAPAAAEVSEAAPAPAAEEVSNAASAEKPARPRRRPAPRKPKAQAADGATAPSESSAAE